MDSARDGSTTVRASAKALRAGMGAWKATRLFTRAFAISR